MRFWKIGAILSLIVCRFFFLDQDASAYQVCNVCQEDEGTYACGAINKYCRSQDRTTVGFSQTPFECMTIYSILPIYYSMKIAGNNLWGLRIPAVLASILIVLLLFNIMRIIRPNDPSQWLFLLLILSNFYFFIFSRFNSPQIFSLLAITITIWVYFKYGYSKWYTAMLAGLLAASAVCIVYVLNGFLLAGVGIFMLVTSIRNKKIAPVLFFALGVAVSFLFYLFCLHAIGSNIGAVLSELTGKGEYSALHNSANGFSLIAWLSKNLMKVYSDIMAFICTGFFRYSLPFLFLFLISLAYWPFIFTTSTNAKEKDGLLLVALVLVFHVLQSYFLVSYPFKKLVVDLPLVFTAIYIAFPYFKIEKQQSFKFPMLLTIAAIIALVFCILNFKINKSHTYWSGFDYLGYYETTPIWFDIINVCSLLLLFGAFIFQSKLQLLIKCGIGLSVICGIAFSYTVCFKDRRYEIRDCLINIKSMAENKVLASTWSPHNFEFYTNCKPALQDFPFQKDGNYSSPKRFNSIMDSMLTHKNIDFVVTKRLYKDTHYSIPNDHLKLVKAYNFKYYSYYLYSNTCLDDSVKNKVQL